jgi:hypothetical protein
MTELKIGYRRVSTVDQDLTAQRGARWPRSASGRIVSTSTTV